MIPYGSGGEEFLDQPRAMLKSARPRVGLATCERSRPFPTVDTGHSFRDHGPFPARRAYGNRRVFGLGLHRPTPKRALFVHRLIGPPFKAVHLTFGPSNTADTVVHVLAALEALESTGMA